MPTLHVCPLSCLHRTVAATGASHMVTLMGADATVERPATIAADRHLFIRISDIVAPMDGHVLPGEEHIGQLLAFVRAWGRESPLVFHCWAGISRSWRITSARAISSVARTVSRPGAPGPSG